MRLIDEKGNQKGIMGLEIEVPPLALEELKNNPRALINSESKSSILDAASAEIGSDSFNEQLFI